MPRTRVTGLLLCLVLPFLLGSPGMSTQLFAEEQNAQQHMGTSKNPWFCLNTRRSWFENLGLPWKQRVRGGLSRAFRTLLHLFPLPQATCLFGGAERIRNR